MAAKIRILFLYPDPPGFSGQRNAAEMVLRSIDSGSEFTCLPIKIPALPKTGSGFLAITRFFFGTSISMVRLIWLSLFGRVGGIFIALSQTKNTLSREHLLLRVVKLLTRKRDLKTVYRLDSSIFTHWDGSEPVANRFRQMVHQADFVGVLGPAQFEVLSKQYAGSRTQVKIVPNTCEIKTIPSDQLVDKHNQSPLNVLHLSSLMEVKGYDRIINSIEYLDDDIEFTICGKLTTNEFSSKFPTLKSQLESLEQQLLNFPNLRWIDGAVGEAKKKLFDTAQVFVLPTFYPVEAQPLVLLEAMASGCTVIATAIGEIPFMVDRENSIVLPDAEPESIAAAISRLKNEDGLRLKLAENALQTYLNKFSLSSFESSWQRIFSDTYIDD